MSSTETIELAKEQEKDGRHQRRAMNAILQPFLQFKLLLYMLGSTVVVAVLLSVFLYIAFSDMIGTLAEGPGAANYYAEMIEIQLVHLFRYCGVLFVLYILLLAVVCIAYTHKLIGPSGEYNSRVSLRKGDPDLFQDYADKLNALAEKLEKQG